MAERIQDIVGYGGVDATTDPFVLGKQTENKSSMSLNYRAKSGVKRVRGGYRPVLDASTSGYLKKSGVYFPHDSLAILPHVKDDYAGSYYLASWLAGGVDQYEFTLEFWYKADYQAYPRTVCGIPVDMNAGALAKHMWVTFDPITYSTSINTTHLSLTAVVENGGTLYECVWAPPVDTLALPMDGEWHHVSLVRYAGGPSLAYYVDGTAEGDYLAGTPTKNLYNLPQDSSFKNEHNGPLMYNYMRFGGGGIHLADFRLWNVDKRDSSNDLDSGYTAELTGSEDNLVMYIPFDEGGGKHFTDQAGGGRGYFSPQNPYVNDDNELVFTGYQCLAHPSSRSKWIIPGSDAAGLKSVADKTPDNRDGCEDGAYDGGILWDDRLWLETTRDDNYNGIWAGSAQLRLRLRQLKEGVICGRLGMCYSPADERYRLFLASPSEDTVYLTDPIIDSSWIGVEKTISIRYDGDSTLDLDEQCRFFVDEVEVTDSSQSASERVWADATDILDSSYAPIEDKTDAEDEPAGALGGSLLEEEMCVAFDLIFFRQWWDEVPAYGDDSSTDFESFVSATYNLSSLTPEYRTLLENVRGYFEKGENYVTLVGDEDTLMNDDWIGQGKTYMRIPIHNDSDWWNMNSTSTISSVADGSFLHIWEDSSTFYTFKQDVLVRRVHDWDSTGERVEILRDTRRYEMSDVFHSVRHFGGALFSNLVNEYDSNTFKFNQEERPVYEEYEDSDMELRTLRIMDTIVDGSPLQGIETAGSTIRKSRYLILSGFDPYATVYKQSSLFPRWCTGPDLLTPTTLPAVRGIHRYRSESGDVDKLLVVAYSSIWEVDTSTGVITEQDWGWLERNGDEPVNFTAINNRLIVMDSVSAIKINYKGNWSRLGIERPVDIEVDNVTSGDSNSPHPDDAHYGYVAQFYDSENDAYSGTIPVYSDRDQTIKLLNYSDAIAVQARACKDYNVDRVLFYRTYEMENGSGTESDLFLVRDTDNVSRLDNWVKVKDVWIDAKVTSRGQSYLSSSYYGQDVKPPACEAMGVGYNRLWLFNAASANAGLYYSDADTLGLARPDQFPALNSIILEEGNTTGGTALIEFSSQLFCFKEDAIFRVYEYAAGQYGSEMVYKGVGALNQRCVVVAGNAIFFLDKNGLYAYQQGEPMMVSREMERYFDEEVSTDLSSSFLLHYKADDLIMAFVPSSGSTYPDRVVIYDMRQKVFSVDEIFDVTCGYVDVDDTIYLGTPYGQVLKYDPTTYVDVADEAATGTGTAT